MCVLLCKDIVENDKMACIIQNPKKSEIFDTPLGVLDKGFSTCTTTTTSSKFTSTTSFKLTTTITLLLLLLLPFQGPAAYSSQTLLSFFGPAHLVIHPFLHLPCWHEEHSHTFFHLVAVLDVILGAHIGRHVKMDTFFYLFS